ncbi:MAG: hypothetical protein GXP55_21910 [Deltaproteobacteria bacterium]|nr:hypothetical protein [Deltaproteobacteria bacterium]
MLESDDLSARVAAGCLLGATPSAEQIACMETQAMCSPSEFIAFLGELNAYLVQFQECTYNECILEDDMGMACDVAAPDMVRIGSPPQVADAQCMCDWAPFDSHLLFCPNVTETDALNLAIERYFYLYTRIERKLGQCTAMRSAVPDGYVACVESRARAFSGEFSMYLEAVEPRLEERWMCVVGATCDELRIVGACPTAEDLAGYPVPPDVSQALLDCYRPENRL